MKSTRDSLLQLKLLQSKKKGVFSSLFFQFSLWCLSSSSCPLFLKTFYKHFHHLSVCPPSVPLFTSFSSWRYKERKETRRGTKKMPMVAVSKDYFRQSKHEDETCILFFFSRIRTCNFVANQDKKKPRSTLSKK